MSDTEAPARATRQPAVASAPELSIVVPCYNEAANLAPLVARLDAALAGIAWEVLFVDDDSPDGTGEQARRLGARDGRVRCLRRLGRRGLASAVIEGALASSARFIAVMDGDLQHDETRLPPMLALLRADAADLVVGSRYVGDADDAGLSSAWRRRLSRAGVALTDRLLPARLADPLSGFFMLPRAAFEYIAPRLAGQGFKILLDLVMSAPHGFRTREIPAALRARATGESKLDALVFVQFAALLLDKATGGLLPLRFVAFALVGAFGVLVNLLVLSVGRSAHLGFGPAQALGTIVAMVSNFALNNRITYADQRLRGRRLWTGLGLFMAVCGLGGVANVGIASLLNRDMIGWQPAGAAGAAIGVVWNYAVSATLVWRPRRR